MLATVVIMDWLSVIFELSPSHGINSAHFFDEFLQDDLVPLNIMSL
jgi:hypothetical protein